MEITKTKNGLFRITLPCLAVVLALVLPLMAVLFTAKPVEAG
jgi:hypothetical protein